jgi:two-component system, NarL family, nitrate/nitrite response regulator NarL
LLEREGAVRSRPSPAIRTKCRLAAATRPDVLMLDLNIGGTDGIQVMQELRADGFSCCRCCC